jgi:hypothetical protein
LKLANPVFCSLENHSSIAVANTLSAFFRKSLSDARVAQSSDRAVPVNIVTLDLTKSQIQDFQALTFVGIAP